MTTISPENEASFRKQLKALTPQVHMRKCVTRNPNFTKGYRTHIIAPLLTAALANPSQRLDYLSLCIKMLRENTDRVDPSDIDEYLLHAKDFKPPGAIISLFAWPGHVQTMFKEFTGLAEYIKDTMRIANDIVDTASSRALNPTMDHEVAFIIPMIVMMRFPYHEHRAIRSIMTYLVVMEAERPHVTKKDILEAVVKYQLPMNDIIRMPFGGWDDMVYHTYELCVEEAERMIAANQSL